MENTKNLDIKALIEAIAFLQMTTVRISDINSHLFADIEAHPIKGDMRYIRFLGCLSNAQSAAVRTTELLGDFRRLRIQLEAAYRTASKCDAQEQQAQEQQS